MINKKREIYKYIYIYIYLYYFSKILINNTKNKK